MEILHRGIFPITDAPILMKAGWIFIPLVGLEVERSANLRARRVEKTVAVVAAGEGALNAHLARGRIEEIIRRGPFAVVVKRHMRDEDVTGVRLHPDAQKQRVVVGTEHPSVDGGHFESGRHLGFHNCPGNLRGDGHGLNAVARRGEEELHPVGVVVRDQRPVGVQDVPAIAVEHEVQAVSEIEPERGCRGRDHFTDFCSFQERMGIRPELGEDDDIDLVVFFLFGLISHGDEAGVTRCL